LKKPHRPFIEHFEAKGKNASKKKQWLHTSKTRRDGWTTERSTSKGESSTRNQQVKRANNGAEIRHHGRTKNLADKQGGQAIKRVINGEKRRTKKKKRKTTRTSAKIEDADLHHTNSTALMQPSFSGLFVT